MPIDFQGHRLYTILETAKALRVTPQTVRNYVKVGRLTAQRVGRPLLIPEDSVKALLGISRGATSANITLQK
jgi:excisionase family DNA binding protein